MVLLVEDEPAPREVLAYNLEADGFAVPRAATGQEALMLVHAAAPDTLPPHRLLPNVSGIPALRPPKTPPPPPRPAGAVKPINRAGRPRG